ncbi:hypothetical protein [Rubritalea tangerina]|uniref:hypothetical protein n=1 Tax=Rubritalea tangerina TaxID=430798 RepID=UPI0036071A21
MKLNGTQVTDVMVQALASLPHLEVINLYGTGVTDEGIKALAGMKHLQRVYVWDTEVSSEGAQSLQQELQKHHDEEQAKLVQVILGLDTTMH